MDTLSLILPYLFKYDNAEIVFTGPYQFNVVVRGSIMERVRLEVD